MEASTDFTVDDNVAALCGEATRLVVPTDEDDPGLALAVEAATQLAVDHDLELVLYDRSGERWTDTPHPKGPLRADAIGDERAPLRQRLDELDARGVTATAWLATVPALTAITDVLDEMEVDAMVLPASLGRPRLMDRLQIGDGPAEMVERVAALQTTSGSVPGVLAVDDDRHVRLVTSDDISISEGRAI